MDRRQTIFYINHDGGAVMRRFKGEAQ